MCKLYLMIFFVIGANCDCIAPSVYKDFLARLDSMTTNIQTSDKTCDTVDEYETVDFNGFQENLISKIKYITDQKFASIAEKFEIFRNQIHFAEKMQEITVDLIDCADILLLLSEKISGSYWMQTLRKEVTCDMDTDGGGWLLIQRRRKVRDQVNFLRNWAAYKKGFGELDTEFWIGNEFIHRITNQKSYELRIDMEDYKKGPFYATYSKFKVGNEESRYQLQIGGFNGTAWDNLSSLDGHNFTTFDRPSKDIAINCALRHSNGFWESNFCRMARLNGKYPTNPERLYPNTIRWLQLPRPLVPINVKMMIRPKQ